MNEENLIPLTKKSEEEQRRIRAMGGRAAAKKRKEKRTFKELLEIAMSIQKTDKETQETKSLKDIAMLKLAVKCANGDLKAIALAESILGEVQASKMEVTGKDGQDLIPARRLSREEAADMFGKMNDDY